MDEVRVIVNGEQVESFDAHSVPRIRPAPPVPWMQSQARVERFEHELVHQGERRRTLEQTIEVGWTLLETLPREDLSRLDDDAWAARRAEREASR